MMDCVIGEMDVTSVLPEPGKEVVPRAAPMTCRWDCFGLSHVVFPSIS